MTRVIALCISVLTLAACETTKGVGEDIQNVGGAVTGAATEVQEAL